jgi:adenylate cyclase
MASKKRSSTDQYALSLSKHVLEFPAQLQSGPSMEKDQLSRKLAVILHADVVGSTSLVQLNETIAHERIQSTFHHFSETIKAYGGTTREIRGDALVAEFGRASDAVSASLAFQVQNGEVNAELDDNIQPQLRIGISMGEVIVADNTVTGAGVVLSQRLEQLADSGGVVVQGSVAETVPSRMQFEFEYLGEQQLKGFENSVRAFSVHLRPGETLPEPEIDASAQTLEPGDSEDQKKFSPTSYEALMGEKIKLPNMPSIAILPIQNMSADPDQEYFADGIAEEIISTLSMVPEMIVIARNSSFVYKGRSVDVRQVGKELGVAHVLEGSIRKSGDRVRITAQLVNTQSGDHVWSGRYDRKLDDIFTIQDEITRNIVMELQVNLGEGERSRLRAIGTSSIEAWELVLRAGRLMEGNSRDDHQIAKKLIMQAVEIDRNYSSAWSLMAAIYWHETAFKWSANLEESTQNAIVAAQNAIAEDARNSEGYSALGNIYMLQGDSRQAIEMCEKAVDISPGNSFSMALFANVLIDSGRISEGIQRMKNAIRLCPFPPGWYFVVLGIGLHLDNNNEAAIIALNQASERMPDSLVLRVWKAGVLAEMEKLDEAQALCKAALEIAPNFSALEFAGDYKSSSHARLKGNLLAAGFSE